MSRRATSPQRPVSPTVAGFIATASTAMLAVVVTQFVLRPQLAGTVTLSGNDFVAALAIAALGALMVDLVLTEIRQ